MALTVDIFKDIGLAGGIILLAFKLYAAKDTQQNSQNDLLVQNLIESNKALTEKFDLIIQELRISNSEFMKSNTANNIKLLDEIRESREATKKLINLMQAREGKHVF